MQHAAEGHFQATAQEAGNLSIVFDLGGVFGGALAGALADASGAAACVSAAFVAASVPALVAYRAFGAGSLALNLALMAAAGLAVNGPYALITTAVSADLGSHRSLAGALLWGFGPLRLAITSERLDAPSKAFNSVLYDVVSSQI